jgi:hypothetical protein
LKGTLDFFVEVKDLPDLRFEQYLVCKLKLLEDELFFAGRDEMLVDKSFSEFWLVVSELVLIEVEFIISRHVRRYQFL